MLVLRNMALRQLIIGSKHLEPTYCFHPEEPLKMRQPHCHAQLARLMDFITHGFNTNKHTGLITLDLEKAYDTVWIKGLLFKLINFKFPAYLIHFLHSYLSHRSFSVALSGISSPTKHPTAGLPQGAVISPILFALYTADFPRLPHIQTALFADDTAFFTQSWRIDTISRRLSRALYRIFIYLRRWRLKVNIAKTKAIVFTKRRPTHPAPIQLEGVKIPWTTEVTYLGLQLTTTLNYSSHVKRSAHKALGNLVNLFPLLAKESSLSTAIKLHLYKASIRSTMTYAAPVWCSVSASTYQCIQIVQNKCLRVITNSPRHTPISRLHYLSCIDYIQTYILHIATRFYSTCPNHTNPLIRTIGQYTLQDLTTMYKKYKHKRPRHILL
jgi:hypothetical protein